MLFDIELSKVEVLLLQDSIEFFIAKTLLTPSDKQEVEILANKVKFIKLAMQGHSLETSAQLLGMEEVPDYAPERADAWRTERIEIPSE